MNIATRFDIGDAVMIDGSTEIRAIILAYLVRGKGGDVTVECTWLHNGSAQTAWVNEWRLSAWRD